MVNNILADIITNITTVSVITLEAAEEITSLNLLSMLEKRASNDWVKLSKRDLT